MSAEVAVIVGKDLLVRARMERAAQAAGLTPVVFGSVPAPPESPPAVLVLDLDQPEALDGVEGWRQRWPSLRIVGFVSHVAGDRWAQAEAMGCEVMPRGATALDPDVLKG